MSLLNVLKTLESKINAQLGLGWDEGMPAAPTDKSSSTDTRMEREREAQRAQQIEKELKKMEEQKRKLEVEQKIIEEAKRKNEVEREAKTIRGLELQPGHYYEFETDTTTCNMYFICVIRLGRLVFSSSTYDQIRNYSVEGQYNSNNPHTWIVSKSEIKKIKASANSAVNVSDLSKWIQESRL
jgi:hypothetical protein